MKRFLVVLFLFTIPLLAEEGWLRTEKITRSHRSSADGGRSRRKPDAKRKRDSAQPQERAQPSREYGQTGGTDDFAELTTPAL